MVSDFDITAKHIVQTARGYLGVAFRHQGRDRHGLDCLGLLVRVAQDCGLQRNGKLLARYDEQNYAHLPDEARFLAGLQTVLEPASELALGAVLLLRIDGSARHVALVSDYEGEGYAMIHAYAPARKVIEHRLDAQWRAKIEQVFCLPVAP